MPRLLALLVVCCLTLVAQAQSEFSIGRYADSTGQHMIGMQAESFLRSPQVQNDFMWSLLTGDYLDDALKTEASDRLRDHNLAGADLNLSLYYSFPVKRFLGLQPASMQLFVQVADRQHLDLGFSQDAFNLGFFGNKQFAGDTALLDELRFSQFRYQQLQWGFLADHGTHRWGLALSVLNGEDHLSLDGERARFFTSSTGDSLDLDTRGTLWQSDTGNTTTLANNGLGVSVDVYLEKSIRLLQGKQFGPGSISLEINDLGAIRWNANSIEAPFDTTIQYTGVNFDNLLDLNDSTLDVATPDSIWDDLRGTASSNAFWRPLPANIHLRLTQSHHEHFVLTLGFKQRLWAQFRPYVYLHEAYQISPALQVGASVGYGGYGALTAGIRSAIQVKSWMLEAGTQTLTGFLAPKQFSGNNIYFMLQKRF